LRCLWLFFAVRSANAARCARADVCRVLFWLAGDAMPMMSLMRRRYDYAAPRLLFFTLVCHSRVTFFHLLFFTPPLCFYAQLFDAATPLLFSRFFIDDIAPMMPLRYFVVYYA